MDSNEYQKLKIEIEAKYGKAEYDWDKSPLNESAKQLLSLRSQLMRASKTKVSKTEAEGLLKGIPEAKQKVYRSTPLPVIELQETDLKRFDEVEKDILKAKYADLDVSNKVLAERFHKSVQYVTAFLNSTEVKLLEAKVFDQFMPLELRKALLRACKNDDSKIVQRLAEHFGIIKTEELNLNVNKPLDDPIAIQELRKLGDRLA